MRKVMKSSLYERRPWKNGRGTTQEIIVWPEGAGDQFTWRISLADLKDSGAFSVYPEMNRILVVIEGKEIELTSDGNNLTLPLMTPHSFDGARETHSEVKAIGRDFNLMLRKGKATGKITVHSGRRTFQVTTRFFGVFSTETFQVDDDVINGNDFFLVSDENNKAIRVESREKYLIIEIN